MPQQQPDFIVLKTHRDLAGRANEVWIRRFLVCLVAAVPVLALFNVFGQRPATTSAAAQAASLEVYSPSRVRRFLRPVLEGEPIVIVQDGKVIQRNLERERLTVAEVAAEARQQQIASLEDVQWVVVETNGTISFIPKQ